ncbi:hypothetical protein EDB85DRAFT_2143076 [Lactarius pseudohatsudake]|nr:hypothetical protein EDB85DRAFT_2143076 [Lactarius pseudohatsudake]
MSLSLLARPPLVAMDRRRQPLHKTLPSSLYAGYDLIEPELKSTLAHMTPRLSTHHRGHNESVIRQIEMMDQAHLKRKKAETAAIIAAAAAVQKAKEQRALLEAAAATEA